MPQNVNVDIVFVPGAGKFEVALEVVQMKADGVVETPVKTAESNSWMIDQIGAEVPKP